MEMSSASALIAVFVTEMQKDPSRVSQPGHGAGRREMLWCPGGEASLRAYYKSAGKQHAPEQPGENK